MRNYGLPNLWISNPSEQAYVDVNFNEEKTINEITLTFDSNLNRYLDNLEIHYGQNTIPEIVKDYDIIASHKSKKTIVASVRGNYQRVNKLNFDSIKADSIKIKMFSTNGSKRFGIYDCRIN